MWGRASLLGVRGLLAGRPIFGQEAAAATTSCLDTAALALTNATSVSLSPKPDQYRGINVITYTILGVPFYNVSIVYLKTRF